MGKKKDAAALRAAEAAVSAADVAVEQALRAVVMRREGMSYGDIADRLGIEQLQAEEYAKIGYQRLGAAEAEQLRIEVEERLDALVRRAHLDIGLATVQSERTALYRFLASVEGQRARLLGLNLPAGGETNASEAVA